MDHLMWRVRVDFDSRTLHAEATISFNKHGNVVLDTRGLIVSRVMVGTSTDISFEMGDTDPILGTPLIFEVPANCVVKIVYTTSPDAMALQWIEPAQTAGKKLPYLYSQGEPIHARSMVPCHDSPGVRFIFTAHVEVPSSLRAIMAATFVERSVSGTLATEVWETDHPIPAYLLALAVGNLESRELSPRSRVWSEPEMVEKAAWEFAGVEQMMQAAERLFGKYQWGRFDILVMPPSFPYGGMENPGLTFVTPLTVAGDRSSVYVIVHELAHAWTGNLVTNRTWCDFWLNEGWTTWAEMRLMEALYGADIAGLQALRGRQELERSMKDFLQKGKSKLTRLFTPLAGEDPDNAFSQIPYTKGYLFLRVIEEAVGREEFDAFVKKYIAAFAFKSIGTMDFLEFLGRELPDAGERVPYAEWVYGEGLLEAVPVITSKIVDSIHTLVAMHTIPTHKDAAQWNPVAWLYYLAAILRDANACTLCSALEESFHLSTEGNARKRWAWYMLAIESEAEYDHTNLVMFLKSIGNMYYLKTLFKELFTRRASREWAISVFEYVCHLYHPITIKVIGAQKNLPLID
ncbi:MAG: leukotriene A4 hydrolase C-terminal domain-containing protein [Candidatus Magasanikbacteria bacterium]|nr:leukotriene A4 hydrolase C-terminal domain-containing protein [Candidatus Magasanikbacteria bacterium]